MKKILIVLTALSFIIFTFTNCAKKKQNLLIGEWENVPLTESDTAHNEIWTFESGGTFKYQMDSVTITANYNFISKTFNAFAEIYGINEQLNNQYFDGLYKIEDIDKDILVLQCEEPYKHKEFKRKE